MLPALLALVVLTLTPSILDAPAHAAPEGQMTWAMLKRGEVDIAHALPIWEFVQLYGVGPRVEEAGLGLVEYMPFTAPYEDVRLRKP